MGLSRLTFQIVAGPDPIRPAIVQCDVTIFQPDHSHRCRVTVELAELAGEEILMIRMMRHTRPDFGNGRHAGGQPVNRRMFAGIGAIGERADTLADRKLCGRVSRYDQQLNFRFGLDDGDKGDSHGRLQKGARVSSA